MNKGCFSFFSVTAALDINLCLDIIVSLFVELVCLLNDPCQNGAACSEIDGVNVDCACTFGYGGNFCQTGNNRKRRQIKHSHLIISIMNRFGSDLQKKIPVESICLGKI